MPSRKVTISHDDDDVIELSSKRKKIITSTMDDLDLELANSLYSQLYISSDKLPFSVHKKKLEEAETVFESVLQSSASTSCILLKGPTGCGKGFLIDKLVEKYSHLVRINDIDSLPNTYISFNNPNTDTNSSPKAFKCGNTIFPSLSFSSTVTTSKVLDKRKAILRLTDAHFFYSNSFDKEYVQIRRAIEMLKSHSGIVLIEMTEFEFEGSMHNYILKILKETFPESFHMISMNSCATTIIKKTVEPLNRLVGNFKLSLNDFIDQCNGDPRALLHDLFMISLKPKLDQIDSFRDYRTDFFHYVGKLLYPSKTGTKIFDDVTFWDLDYNLFLVFLQFYFPKFCPDIQIISVMNDYFCNFDIIPWKVLFHVSIENHINACKYAPLLSCFNFINDPESPKSNQKFFSFVRPPLIDEIGLKKKYRKMGLKPEDVYIKNLK